MQANILMNRIFALGDHLRYVTALRWRYVVFKLPLSPALRPVPC